jgi:hypothetical protein
MRERRQMMQWYVDHLDALAAAADKVVSIERALGRSMRIEALRRLISHCPMLAAALVLAGCWVPPVATVQPRGEPRLIQSAIEVTSVRDAAVVSAVDRNAGTIALRAPGAAKTATYKIGHEASGLSDLKPGDVIRATVKEELAVYALGDGRLPGVEGNIAADARVLAVDASYRLLKLQYPDRQSETLKVPPGTRLEQMEAGDSVVIRPVALLALRRVG